MTANDCKVNIYVYVHQTQIVMAVKTNWPIPDLEWTSREPEMLIEIGSNNESMIKSKHTKQPWLRSLWSIVQMHTKTATSYVQKQPQTYPNQASSHA